MSLFPWVVVIDCGINLDITFIVIIIIIGRVGTSLPSCTTGPHCLYVTVCMLLSVCYCMEPNFAEEIVLLSELKLSRGRRN